VKLEGSVHHSFGLGRDVMTGFVCSSVGSARTTFLPLCVGLSVDGALVFLLTAFFSFLLALLRGRRFASAGSFCPACFSNKSLVSPALDLLAFMGITLLF